MARQAPQIREAGPGDAEQLLDLWSAVGRTRDGAAHALEDAERALASLAADPDTRVLVVEHEDRIVAAVHLHRGPMFPLLLESVVHTSFLLVLPQFRRHGYGHALMEAAVSWAEDKGIDEVTVLTDGNRDTNRFFARLGLTTLGSVRHSSTGGLRKKLAGERARVGGNGNRHLVQVLAQRRSMRRRQAET